MGFRVEEVDGTPRAVFEDEDPLRRELLPLLLLPAPYFVEDMLHELSLVERGVTESSGFDTPRAVVEFFSDRVVIETYLPEDSDDEEPPRLELSVEEARLLLLEWGAALQRRHVEEKVLKR
jgi:hypothetical protein